MKTDDQLKAPEMMTDPAEIDGEVWKTIPFTGGHYFVSSMGRVRCEAHKGRRRHVEAKMLRGGVTRRGYMQVTLPLPWGVTAVHRLVAHLFIGPPPEPGYQVNHKNGVKHDNRHTNLEWLTASQNMRHAYRELGRVKPFAPGADNPRAKLSRQQIDWIRRNATGRRGEQTEFASKFGVSQSLISQIISGRIWN